MKELPILYNTEMVMALLAGRKTKSRRTKGLEIINENPDDFEFILSNHHHDFVFKNLKSESNKVCHAKYNIGDLLYVKESYYVFGKWVKNGLTKKGSQKFKFVDLTLDAYLYNYNPPKHIHKGKTEKIGWYKKPSLFMPKSAARIWLRVTDVKVERLQDITADDAIAEGIKKIEGLGYKHYTAKKRFTKEALKDGCPYLNSPILSFLTLWESIYGDESLQANPWVFAYSFEVISTTGAPIKNS